MDYEAWGRWSTKDRPVQFSGVRTDAELNIIDEPVTLYAKPSPDFLPLVRACLVHGISPQVALARGVTEFEFAQRIQALFDQKDTCIVGYNAMRFDHHLTRFMFWRSLMDPYRWHYANGNTRWDIIDLLRAAYALRPDGMNWPHDEQGAPQFKLDALARANSVRVERAHDAWSDVSTTLALARMIKARHPKLFDYYLSLRRLKAVEEQVGGTFIYVSGAVLRHRRRATLVRRLNVQGDGYHLYAFDLAYDARELLRGTVEELVGEDGLGRRALHRFNPKASPFVLKFDIRRPMGPRRAAMFKRLDLPLAKVLANDRLLRESRHLTARIEELIQARWSVRDDADVDRALYGGSNGFIGRSDRRRMLQITVALKGGERPTRQRFEDSRLPKLAKRFQARNFPETLTPAEAVHWHAHCRTRIFETPDAEGRTCYDNYVRDIAEHKRREQDPKRLRLLDDLAAYGEELRVRLMR